MAGGDVMAHLAAALKDDRVMNVAAIVQLQPDGSPHYEIDDGQVTLYCVGRNTHRPFWAYLGGTKTGRGTWTIPDPGTEVLIGFDDGDSEGDAYVAGFFGVSAPGNLDATTTVIQDDKITLGSTDLENVLTETDASRLAALFQDATVIGALSTYIATCVPPSTPVPAPFQSAVAAYFSTTAPVPGTNTVQAKRS